MTAVWFFGVFVISVLYRQSHEDGCQLHPCVCDFSVIHTEPGGRLSELSLCSCVYDFSVIQTEPWGRLSASSLCLWFQCHTDRAIMTVVSIILVFVISVLYTQSHEDCCQLHPCVCDFSVIHTEPWGRLSASSLCLWFQCYTDRAMRTAVSFILVFVISVLYTQSHEDCCQLHPCVCDFSVIHTEPCGRLWASSLSAFCFNSVCTLSLAKFTQVTSVFPIANINNKTSQYPPLLFRKRGRGNKTAIHNL